MNVLARLWSNESGEASSMSLILLTTIIALGAIVGLVSLRDQVIQEMGDYAIALENLNQSFSFSGGTFTDSGPFPVDPPGEAPACIAICDS
jgi:hypothetical protein